MWQELTRGRNRHVAIIAYAGGGGPGRRRWTGTAAVDRDGGGRDGSGRDGASADGRGGPGYAYVATVAETAGRAQEAR